MFFILRGSFKITYKNMGKNPVCVFFHLSFSGIQGCIDLIQRGNPLRKGDGGVGGYLKK